jgi:hypothetical protein
MPLNAPDSSGSYRREAVRFASLEKDCSLRPRQRSCFMLGHPAFGAGSPKARHMVSRRRAVNIAFAGGRSFQNEIRHPKNLDARLGYLPKEGETR